MHTHTPNLALFFYPPSLLSLPFSLPACPFWFLPLLYLRISLLCLCSSLPSVLEGIISSLGGSWTEDEPVCCPMLCHRLPLKKNPSSRLPLDGIKKLHQAKCRHSTLVRGRINRHPKIPSTQDSTILALPYLDLTIQEWGRYFHGLYLLAIGKQGQLYKMDELLSSRGVVEVGTIQDHFFFFFFYQISFIAF